MEAKTEAELRAWLTEYLVKSLEVSREELDPGAPFSSYGLDSLRAIRLLAALAGELGRPLPATLLWDHVSIAALAHALSTPDPPPAPSAPSAAGAADLHEPVAIIGMSGRFPGAPSVAALWQNLCAGVESITEVPAERWHAEAIYSPDPTTPGKVATRRGGFVTNPYDFDPQFFGISPKEAALLDPQQRLMLELSWQALEDAGIASESLRGSQTGVYYGAVFSDYALLISARGLAAWNPHSIVGTLHTFIPNRVSYFLGLHGPSIAVDTACSSSLTAVHLSCSSLRSGESTLVLAGAVSLLLTPDSTVGVGQAGALSPDGRSYTFDARANGYVRGEGGGVVVLKLLRRAIADGDRIYAVIRGTAVNNDGPSNGLTAPNPRAQEALLRTAYARAGIAPAAVDYVELHGTGTQLGDPIEAAALERVLCEGRAADHPLLVGSLKTNIGHLEAAAGIAGLIKAALAVYQREIPASLNYETRNPHVTGDRIQVVTQHRRWPDGEQPAVAGVSSFGMGGANAHVVLTAAHPPRPQLFLAAAADEAGLRQLAAASLHRVLDAPAEQPLAALVGAATGAGPHRLAVCTRSRAALVQQLRAYLMSEPAAGLYRGSASRPSRGPVFVFSGNGSQWLGMGRSLLLQAPVFAAELSRCDRHIRAHLGWSLLDELNAPRERARVDEIDVLCAGVIAIQIALAAELQAQGVRPAATLGHSMGEVAAAQVSGVLSVADAMQIACAEARVLRGVRNRGAMGVVALGATDCAALLAAHPQVHLAIEVSDDTTVLAGERDALAGVFGDLARRGVAHRLVRTEVPAHSPLLQPLQPALLAAMHGVRPQPARIPYFSSLVGGQQEGERADAAHWSAHPIAPARFAAALSALRAAGYHDYVELSPHPLVLPQLVAAAKEGGGAALATLHRGEEEYGALLATRAALYVRGLTADADASAPAASAAPAAAPAERPEPQLLLLSAISPEALRRLAAEFAALLRAPTAPALCDVAYQAAVRRTHHDYRLAVPASSGQDAAALLTHFQRGLPAPGIRAARRRLYRPPRLAFLFSGLGSQWLGMGRRLLAQQGAFAHTIELCAQAIRAEAGWSLYDQLYAAPEQSQLGRLSIVQPVLFAVAVALAAELRARGVEPDLVLGHSMGEVAAAYVSGALTLEDAVAVICRRSALMLPYAEHGGLAVIDAGEAVLLPYLRDQPGPLAVAALNGPRTTTVAGDKAALSQLLLALSRAGIDGWHVRASVASHSAAMDELRPALTAALTTLAPRAPSLPMLSTVTGELLGALRLDAGYWFRNLREPVRLWPVVQQLGRLGYDVLLEVSPHPVLVSSLASGSAAGGPTVLGTVRREQDELRCLQEVLGELYTRGFPLDHSRMFPTRGRFVTLPGHPFFRQRYSITDSKVVTPASAPSVAAGHPLLGREFSVATLPRTRLWEQTLRLSELPYLRDHQVLGLRVMPGAAYLEMALVAAQQVQPAEVHRLHGVTFERVLPLSTEAPPLVQSSYEAGGEAGASFQIASRSEHGWQRHLSCTIHTTATEPTEVGVSGPEPDSAVSTSQLVDGSAWRARASEHGIEYGPSFSGLGAAWLQGNLLLAQVLPPPAVPPPGEGSPYRFHPAVLDACLQTAALLALTRAPGQISDRQPVVPVAIEEVQVFGPLPQPAWVAARLRSGGDDNEQVIDLEVWPTPSGRDAILEVRGLRLRRLASTELPVSGLEAGWHRLDAAPPPAPSTAAGQFLLLADSGSLAGQLVEELQARGETCTVLPLRELGEIDPVAREHRLAGYLAAGTLRAIVHLGSLDATPLPTADGVLTRELTLAGVQGALHTVQALLAAGPVSLPPLWFITRGAAPEVEAEEGDYTTQLLQAPLRGFLRSLRSERAELRLGLVDLPLIQSSDEVARLAELLRGPLEEDELALRPGGLYGLRLTPAALPPPAPFSLRRGGTYLITGGLTGLGLLTAAWLSEHGAENIVLAARRIPIEVSALHKLAQLRERGARVQAVALDVTDRDAVAALLARLRSEGPPLRGIFHAAAVLDDGNVTAMTPERLWRTLAPKILGALYLHELTACDPLEVFVLFSSISSVIGTPGQTNYAAANAFLDALAQARRRLGKPALSVNFGAFRDVGQAASRDGLLAYLERIGIGSMTPQEGMLALGALLAKGAAQGTAARFVPSRFLRSHPHLRAAAAASFSLLRTDSGPVVATAQPPAWQRCPAAERAARLEDRIATLVSELTQLGEARVDRRLPLIRMGLDSLMAAALRNLLAKETAVRVPFSDLLTGATIETLAAYIDQNLPSEP